MVLPLVLAVVTLAAPKLPEGFDERVGEAMRRHDAGDYAAAIAIYRGLLEEAPHQELVVYELSLSMVASRAPPEETIAFIEAELKSGVRQMPQLYAQLATALDTKGELKRGEEVLRKGLKVAADSPDLQFNLGVNLVLQRREAEALGPMLRAVQLKPSWPSAWRALGELHGRAGHNTRALVALARFVALEPDTPRGRAAAQKLWPLLMGPIEVQGEKKMAVTVPGGSAEELGPAMVAATRFTGDWEKKSDGAFFAHAFPQVVQVELELRADPFYDTALELFVAAKKAKVHEALAWELCRAAGDADAVTWFSKHPKEEAALAKFLAPHRKARP